VTGSPSLSAAVLAVDEVHLIAGCIASVSWADDVLIVLDDRATASMEAAAVETGARVVRSRFESFQRQRNRALDLATSQWVLFVDADERVPPALAAEVRQRIGAPGPSVGFWVPRRNVIAGVWVRHAGWWPDYQLRLMERAQARYDVSGVVHEVANLDGPSERLAEPLFHLNYESMAQFRAKQRRYALLEAETLAARGVRARPHSLVVQPVREFRRRVVELQGIKQGPIGVRLGLEMALASFQTYRELLRLTRERDRDCAFNARGAEC
jgi:hypothetical protein